MKRNFGMAKQIILTDKEIIAKHFRTFTIFTRRLFFKIIFGLAG